MNIRELYLLTKPGIIRGNAITATGGFFLAANGEFNPVLFVAMLLGLSCIVASGCVLNNIVDRKIDSRMKRTKRRAIVTGAISRRQALVFAIGLGFAGAAILFYFTNFLTLTLALLGHFMYVVVYGIAKRRTVHGTLVGSIPGAVPPVVGYVAITGALDVVAGLLFLILVFWQMPHFFAIAMFRSKDYAAASIPVLPLVAGSATTKKHILLYIAAFICGVAALTLVGATGYIYIAVMLLTGLWWLRLGFKGYNADEIIWAKKMFGASLVVILVFSVMISLESFLP